MCAYFDARRIGEATSATIPRYGVICTSIKRISSTLFSKRGYAVELVCSPCFKNLFSGYLSEHMMLRLRLCEEISFYFSERIEIILERLRFYVY